MSDVKIKIRFKPTQEDYLRAIAYGWLALWSAVYLFFPPASSAVALDWILRSIWMSFTFFGAAMAFAGAVFRIDIKLELPGILLGALGPLFYCWTQVYFVIVPDPAFGPPAQRFALIVFALLPVLFMLPRAFALFVEARRLKKINIESVQNARSLLAKLPADKVPTGEKK